MATFREQCSDIINDLRSYDLDDRISYRFIISKLKDAASVVLKQDSEYRRLFKVSALWKPLFCVDLEEVSESECDCSYYFCNTIRKSKKKLPDTYEASYGNIVTFSNLNGSKNYKLIKPEDYRAIKARKFKLPTEGYFWLENNYAFFPDTEVDTVKGRGMFKNTIEADIFNGLEGAECTSFLDAQFNFPNYISKLAKDNIIQELAKEKSITVDNNPNMNDLEK